MRDKVSFGGMTSIENLQPSEFSTSHVDHNLENSALHQLNHGEMEPKRDYTDEEVTSILEVIASTGKFWNDWDTLKEILSFRLKQVLAQYPESQMTSDEIGPQQSSLVGETYQELVKRLDEALLSFIEGPPFTLQRLCEILLDAKSIYSNLSKLALALEKNLLVTSTLTICTESYPSATIQKLDESDTQACANPIENGEAMIGDGYGDEEMADAETEEENKQTDMDTTEDKIGEKSETVPLESTTISDAPGERSPSDEQHNPVNS